MRCIAWLAGVLGGAIPVLAQTAVPVIAESVVVTASLDPEEREELPASIEVLDAAEIEARKAPAVADLLSTVAGLTVVRSGSPGQSTSLFSRGTESDHTLVLWNGIELNDPYFAGFNWAFLPTEGVERVEVARGPFSALYGSDALGGVVHILSGPLDGAVLRLEGGERGHLRGAVVAGLERGAGRFDVTAHLRRGEGERPNDDYDGEEVAARAEWRVGERWSLGVVTRWNDSDTGIPLSGRLPTLERRIAWREWEVAVPARAEIGGWELDLRLSRVRYESAFRDPDDPFGFTAADTESESLRLRSVASHRFGERLRVAVGAEVERLEVDDRSVFGTNLDGDGQRTRALFGQLLYRAGGWGFDLGLRRDDNDVFGGETSPKLGVSRRLGERARLWAAYGKGFRAPSVGELFFPFSGNGDLEPERSDSFELGLELAGDDWRLTMAAFENRIRDLIDFDFATLTNVNVGRARTRGVEAGLRYRTGPAAWRWSVTWLEAEDRDAGLDLLRRPRWTSSLVLALEPADWRLSLTGLWVGERPDLDPVTFTRADNPSYLRFDLAAEWRPQERWRPHLRVENAADRRYEEALGFPAPRRTLVAGLTVSP